jgi:adenosylcobinamide-GDP ribazoletransferase
MSVVRTEFEALRAAVMFFTRIPLPSARTWDPESLQRAAAYFPLVGWIVGGVAAGVWWLAMLVWPPLIASGVSLAATLLLTGAFHEDGFADVCDGFGGGTTRERVLEIMRDSRIGAFGAIGVSMMLGGKWHTVAALPEALAPWTLLAGHTLSRGAAATIMTTLVYVQVDGKAKPLATRLRGGRFVVSLVFALAPLALLPPRYWWGIAAVACVRVALTRWFVTRIGGYTGDCLGAAQQVSELAFLLTTLAIARTHP